MRYMNRLVAKCTTSPLRIAVTTATVMPGMHLLLSTLVERRPVNWTTEYPAVLVGDPMLALSAGIAAQVAGAETVRKSPLLRPPLAPAIAGAALAFGAWQLRDEMRRGVYTRQQAFSPSKLWHQFVVYPTMSPLVAASVLAATIAATVPEARPRHRAGAMLAWAGVAGWGFLVFDAIRRPHQGHGAFDWRAFTRRNSTL